MGITLSLEVPEYSHDRREADAAGDEDDPRGLAAGEGEIAVRAVEIGAGAESDRPDPVGEIAALLDREGDPRPGRRPGAAA